MPDRYSHVGDAEVISLQDKAMLISDLKHDGFCIGETNSMEFSIPAY